MDQTKKGPEGDNCPPLDPNPKPPAKLEGKKWEWPGVATSKMDEPRPVETAGSPYPGG